MESHLSTVILLLVLCATDVKPDDVPKDVQERYEKFLRQHVYENMNEHICDSAIKIRNIYIYNPKTKKYECKEVNSFIKADKRLIRTVCNGAGTICDPIKKLYVSNQPFPVVTCKEKKGSKYPNCKYRGIKSTRYIVLGCDKGWPTHYEEDIIVTSSRSNCKKV